MSDWKKLSSRTVYENPWVTLSEDKVINPAGTETVYSTINTKTPVVYVAAVDENENIHMVEQYRYPSGNKSWELVAGHSDGEALPQAARRELREEAGIEADEIEEVAMFYMETSLSSTEIHIFVAQGLKKVTDELDKVDGILQTRKFSEQSIRDMVLSGEMHDPHSFAGVIAALDHIRRKNRDGGEL